MSMSIQEAKSDLEQHIILWDGVIGIGLIKYDNQECIEISIQEHHAVIESKIKALCAEKHWEGFSVKIVHANSFSAQ